MIKNSARIFLLTLAAIGFSSVVYDSTAEAAAKPSVSEKPVVISNVSSSTTSTSATISFTTNVAANSSLSYGTSTLYGTTVSKDKKTKSTTYTLTGLTPLTVYHFMITAYNSSGVAATTTDLTFKTGRGPMASTTPTR